jgi:hypothetical protein
MLWLGIAMTLATGLVILTLIVVVHRKRPFDVRALGFVSHRWIAAHLADSRSPRVGRPGGRQPS